MEYQGIAIIWDVDEGPCITYYGPQEKRDFDLDISEGKQPGGRRILGHRWLDKPLNKENDEGLAEKVFQESLENL